MCVFLEKIIKNFAQNLVDFLEISQNLVQNLVDFSKNSQNLVEPN